MRRERLFFKEMSEIVGSNGLTAVVLTDEAQQRALTIVLDSAMTEQIHIRLKDVPGHVTMLPEVLLSMMEIEAKDQLELMVYDVSDGQYLVMLAPRKLLISNFELQASNLAPHQIRMGDAILLSIIARIPIYIEEGLFNRQSSPYKSGCQGLQIPINVIDTGRLNVELQKAIDNEDYRLASCLHKEITRRKAH